MKRIIFVLFLGLIFLGCGKKEEVKKETEGQEMMHHEGMEHQKEMEKMEKGTIPQGGVTIRKARKDESGKAVTCPVMGTKFKVKEGGLVADYKGKSYHLCCSACVKAIKNNPDKYTK